MTTVHNGSIWAIGGKDADGNILKSVQRYSKSKSKWVDMEDLPIPIMLGSSVSVEESLFVIGGTTGTISNPKALKRIYRFDEVESKWELWTNMS